MTNNQILKIAMKQSAVDLSCKAEDFLTNENKVFESIPNSRARKYLKLPFSCNIVSYGNNIVASVDKKIKREVEAYINTYQVEHCFETPNMYILNEQLEKLGVQVCFMAEYFLPDIEHMHKLPCPYQTRIVKKEELEKLYLPEWSNALCKKRKELDRVAVGAFDNGKLVGLAGCSADCDSMWQIGVDVLENYRRKGIASALVSSLTLELLPLGIIPFYCCAWSNLKSVRTAIKSGLKPAWVEMTAKSNEFISDMNFSHK